MSNFDININITKLMHYSAVSNKDIGKETLLLMIESFSNYMSRVYKYKIEENISSSRYKGKWEPLEEEGYIEYLGITPKVSIIDLIKDSIETVKIGYNFIIRIDPNYEYPGSDIPLIEILRAIEYGTSKFNPRPLLNDVSRRLSNSILDYWLAYLIMKGVV